MTLAELVIRMSADTASLRTDFDKAGKYAKDAASVITGALQGISFAAIATEMEKFADDFGKVGESIAKAARITGAGAEELSGLRLMALESGESFEGLSVTLGRAGKNIESGLINPSNEAGKLLASLFSKAEIDSLKLEPAAKRIQDVAQKVFFLSDAGERDYAASAIFGRGWAQASETLEKLAGQGLDPAIGRAKDLGQLFGETDVRAAKEFESSLATLKAAFEGLEISLGSKLVQPLEQLFGLLSRNKLMTAEFSDELKLLSIGFEAQVSSLTNFFGMNNADLEEYAKQATDIATDQHRLLSQYQSEMGAIANPAHPWAGVGEGLHLTPRGKKKRGIEEDLTDSDTNADDKKPLASYMDSLRQFSASMYAGLNPLSEYIQQTEKLHDAFNSGLVSADDYGLVMDKIWSDFGQKEPGDYAKTLRELDQAFKDGTMDGGQYLEMSREITKEYLQAKPMAIPFERTSYHGLFPVKDDQFKKLDKSALDFGTHFSSAINQMIISGKGFNSLLESMTEYLAEAVIKVTVFEQLSKAFGGLNSSGGANSSGIGGFLASLFGGLAGGKAAGGPVTAGDLYVVGEQGPELFASGSNGAIIPNDAFGGGGGGTVNNYVDARGAQPGVEHQVIRALQAMQKQGAAQSLATAYEYTARGGKL